MKNLCDRLTYTSSAQVPSQLIQTLSKIMMVLNEGTHNGYSEFTAIAVSLGSCDCDPAIQLTIMMLYRATVMFSNFPCQLSTGKINREANEKSEAAGPWLNDFQSSLNGNWECRTAITK